jgi:hypothetical protein
VKRTPAETDVIRQWIVERVTLTTDNTEHWYVRLQAAAARGVRAVADELRELIQEDPDTARLILLDVLDLTDWRQAHMFHDHYTD